MTRVPVGKLSVESADRMAVRATKGSLDPQALADLLALKKAAEVQMQAYRELWGTDLSSSRSREHILRLVVIEFGFGRFRTVSFYAEALFPLFSGEEVEQEILHLEEVGLVIREESDELAPSEKVVAWYNHVLPLLMEGAAQILNSR